MPYLANETCKNKKQSTQIKFVRLWYVRMDFLRGAQRALTKGFLFSQSVNLSFKNYFRFYIFTRHLLARVLSDASGRNWNAYNVVRHTLCNARRTAKMKFIARNVRVFKRRLHAAAIVLIGSKNSAQRKKWVHLRHPSFFLLVIPDMWISLSVTADST